MYKTTKQLYIYCGCHGVIVIVSLLSLVSIMIINCHFSLWLKCAVPSRTPPNQNFQTFNKHVFTHSPQSIGRFFIGCQDASSQEFTIGFLPRSSCIDFRHHHFTGNWKKGKGYAHDLNGPACSTDFFSGHQKKWWLSLCSYYDLVVCYT